MLPPSPDDDLIVHDGQHILLCLHHSHGRSSCHTCTCHGIQPSACLQTFLPSPFFRFSLASNLVQKGLDNRESFSCQVNTAGHSFLGKHTSATRAQGRKNMGARQEKHGKDEFIPPCAEGVEPAGPVTGREWICDRPERIPVNQAYISLGGRFSTSACLCLIHG